MSLRSTWSAVSLSRATVFPWARRLAGEPFVHFVVLGALIFIAAHAFDTGAAGSNSTIELHEQDLQQLRAQSRLQWGSEPSARAMDDLVQAWVREEVLVREALAQGLEKDDVVVRRRLAQKMEFLAQSADAAPSEAALQAFYRDQLPRYMQPARVDLEQRFFSADLRGAAAQQDALAARAALLQGQPVAGDRSMLPAHLQQVDADALARDFGNDFAHAVFRFAPQQWSVPLPSAHGWHLVRVTRQQPQQAQPYAQVRERVAQDWANAQATQQRDRAYAALRSKYTVVLPPSAPLQVSALAAQNPAQP